MYWSTPKSYHLVKREESNKNGNFEKDKDLSEHISQRLRKMAMLERRPKDGMEGSHSRSSDYAPSTPLSIENRYPNQTQQ